MSRPLLLASVFSQLLVGHVLAQPPSGPPVHLEQRAALVEGTEYARLVSRWAPTEEASGLDLVLGSAPSVALAVGSAAGALEASSGVILVAYAVLDREAPFRVRTVTRVGATTVLGEERSLARPVARSADVPFAVAIAPTPDGFAVFFQEIETADPTAAHTYLFRLDADAAPLGDAREVPVPWALGAAAWNGDGFHLGLFYSGSGDGIRLSMVALTEDGQPRQHPDWSSAPGVVSDVHLVRDGAQMRAFYRGGRGGDRLLEGEVTTIGSWGGERAHTRDLGALRRNVVIGIAADGTPHRVDAPD